MTCTTETMQNGAIGVAITMQIVDQDGVIIDVSTATVMTIYLKKPDGITVLTKTAEFVTDGTDGFIQYVTISGDIDQTGIWEAQGYVELASLKSHTVLDNFKVLRNIQ